MTLRYCWHNAKYMRYTCYGIVYVIHMCAVLWSAVLHTMLHAAQPLHPLHSLALDWLHTNLQNCNQTYQTILSPLGARLCTKTWLKHNKQDCWGPSHMLGHTHSLCISHIN